MCRVISHSNGTLKHSLWLSSEIRVILFKFYTVFSISLGYESPIVKVIQWWHFNYYVSERE